MTVPFSTGQVIQFDYPKSNQLNARRIHYVRRTLYVTAIRDVGQRGLAPVTIQHRPMLNRGRWLITGFCLDHHAERSFYLESMREYQTTTWYTLGLFDPLDDDPAPFWTRGRFAPTARDRRFLSDVLTRYDELAATNPDNVYVLSVLPLRQASSVIQQAAHA